MNKLKKIAVVITAMVTTGYVGNMAVSKDIMTDTFMTAHAAYYGEFEYSTETDGSVTISKYTGTAETVTIPSAIYGRTVKKIGKSAFYENKTIKKVTLPNTIVEIGAYAFIRCEKLETINIPDSVKKIDKYAFQNCSSMKTFDFNKVEIIGEGVLSLCLGFDEIYVPGTIKNIPCKAFHGCYMTKTLIFGSGVTTIEADAALNMYGLQKIVIPASVTSIGEHALLYSLNGSTYSLSVSNLNEYDFVEDTAGEKYGLDNGIIIRESSSISGSGGLANLNPITPPLIATRITGDVDGGGSVDASDASVVLAEYSAIQTGGEESFTAAQKRLADVNRDDVVDASDASEILRYYAEASTGKNPTWSFAADISAKINRADTNP